MKWGRGFASALSPAQPGQPRFRLPALQVGNHCPLSRRRPLFYNVAMRVRALFILAILLGGSLLWLLTDSQAASPIKSVTLFYTGWVRGSYAPCG